MKVITEKQYCDRCGKELQQHDYYSNIFKCHDLRLKFYRLKFLGMPYRWSKSADIENKYFYDVDKHKVLCPECAEEFVQWWEAKGEKND